MTNNEHLLRELICSIRGKNCCGDSKEIYVEDFTIELNPADDNTRILTLIYNTGDRVSKIIPYLSNNDNTYITEFVIEDNVVLAKYNNGNVETVLDLSDFALKEDLKKLNRSIQDFKNILLENLDITIDCEGDNSTCIKFIPEPFIDGESIYYINDKGEKIWLIDIPTKTIERDCPPIVNPPVYNIEVTMRETSRRKGEVCVEYTYNLTKDSVKVNADSFIMLSTKTTLNACYNKTTKEKILFIKDGYGFMSPDFNIEVEAEDNTEEDKGEVIIDNNHSEGFTISEDNKSIFIANQCYIDGINPNEFSIDVYVDPNKEGIHRYSDLPNGVSVTINQDKTMARFTFNCSIFKELKEYVINLFDKFGRFISVFIGKPKKREEPKTYKVVIRQEASNGNYNEDLGSLVFSNAECNTEIKDSIIINEVPSTIYVKYEEGTQLPSKITKEYLDQEEDIKDPVLEYAGTQSCYPITITDNTVIRVNWDITIDNGNSPTPPAPKKYNATIVNVNNDSPNNLTFYSAADCETKLGSKVEYNENTNPTYYIKYLSDEHKKLSYISKLEGDIDQLIEVNPDECTPIELGNENAIITAVFEDVKVIEETKLHIDYIGEDNSVELGWDFFNDEELTPKKGMKLLPYKRAQSIEYTPRIGDYSVKGYYLSFGENAGKLIEPTLVGNKYEINFVSEFEEGTITFVMEYIGADVEDKKDVTINIYNESGSSVPDVFKVSHKNPYSINFLEYFKTYMEENNKVFSHFNYEYSHTREENITTPIYHTNSFKPNTVITFRVFFKDKQIDPNLTVELYFQGDKRVFEKDYTDRTWVEGEYDDYVNWSLTREIAGKLFNLDIVNTIDTNYITLIPKLNQKLRDNWVLDLQCGDSLFEEDSEETPTKKVRVFKDIKFNNNSIISDNSEYKTLTMVSGMNTLSVYIDCMEVDNEDYDYTKYFVTKPLDESDEGRKKLAELGIYPIFASVLNFGQGYNHDTNEGGWDRYSYSAQVHNQQSPVFVLRDELVLANINSIEVNSLDSDVKWDSDIDNGSFKIKVYTGNPEEPVWYLEPKRKEVFPYIYIPQDSKLSTFKYGIPKHITQEDSKGETLPILYFNLKTESFKYNQVISIKNSFMNWDNSNNVIRKHVNKLGAKHYQVIITFNSGKVVTATINIPEEEYSGVLVTYNSRNHTNIRFTKNTQDWTKYNYYNVLMTDPILSNRTGQALLDKNDRYTIQYPKNNI